jgi:hypothetical protein
MTPDSRWLDEFNRINQELWDRFWENRRREMTRSRREVFSQQTKDELVEKLILMDDRNSDLHQEVARCREALRTALKDLSKANVILRAFVKAGEE